MAERRSWWGWGLEGQGPSRPQQEAIATGLAARFGREVTVADPARLEDLELPPPRIQAPESLAPLCSTGTYERAGHSYGRSYRDVVRGFRGQFDHPPDVVAFPADEAELASLLEWASDADVAVVPYGGGSSVVGGVECPADGHAGVLTVDLGRMDGLVELDRTSRAARIQAGILGPALEDRLRPHGLTLRHFPQSFEFSSLGGWLATRSGGHYATARTHIDDFVESMRVLTPAGAVESRRLPGSGAGPSPDRLFLGSEGILGVITEAWIRLQDRPRFRSSAAVRFERYSDAVAATRAVVQAGLQPANCRLLDEAEAASSAGSGGGVNLLVLGFESADHPVGGPMDRALEICAGHSGSAPDGVRSSGPEDGGGAQREGSVGAWRNAFIRAPYTRDALVAMAVIVETFETACTWDRFADLHAGVTQAVEKALVDICGGGLVTCRFTHVYPDGPAPYFSVLAPGRRGSEISQWDEIKAAASEAVMSNGGTITHHHAVGRDHRPWYDHQRPELFAEALRAAKAALDPAGVMNPGVLVEPRG
ncbi:MAG TPA: FAD-binding oxidoreductase [Acidimicrobiales bacterium]|nr:FAD-binding oxidoreductase [Acidimicrobiales bacterium]